MIRTILAAAAAAAFALPAAALERLAAPGSVAETMDRLVAAVEGAGAVVIGRVDHAGAAEGAEMELPEAQLLIFGNAAVGTPVMQEDLDAGLVLPLRVLVRAGEGGTEIVWQSPAEMFAGLGVDPEGEAVARVAGALDKLTAAAAE